MLTIVASIGSTVAIAGRGVRQATTNAPVSTCREPPSSIPKATQLKAEQALNAGVLGMGSAGASSAVEKVAEYDTVLFQQDDAYKAWIDYQMCLRAESGMIPREFYQAWLAVQFGMTTPSASGSPAASNEPSSGAPAGAAGGPSPSIAGMWRVDLTSKTNTCLGPAPANYGAFWSVSLGADGAATVEITGTTSSYPRLTGTLGPDGALVVGGRSNAPLEDCLSLKVWGTTSATVRLEAGQLVGQRIVSTIESHGEYPGDRTDQRACTVVYEVRGSR